MMTYGNNNITDPLFLIGCVLLGLGFLLIFVGIPVSVYKYQHRHDKKSKAKLKITTVANPGASGSSTGSSNLNWGAASRYLTSLANKFEYKQMTMA